MLVAVLALSRERGRAFSSAIVYLLMGAALAIALNAFGFRFVDPLREPGVIERAAELAVIVALFSAGIRLDRPLGWRNWSSTVRLLVVAMPLTIAGVAALSHLTMGLPVGIAIVLGAALAPTDPVLASDVQVGPPGEEEEESEPRFALTAEAGLNDGLAFPFVFLGLLVAAPGDGWLGEWLAADVLYAVPAGLAIGALAGWALGAATAWLRRHDWLLAEYDGWIAVAGVLAIYGVAEVAGAYGFLAAFAGGLAFRRRERNHEYHRPVHEGATIVEKVAELALILLVGSTVTFSGIGFPGWGGLLLALTLLFAIRPLSVLVALLGSRLGWRERAFVGWFGVRGIGSFYYAAVAIGAAALSEGQAASVYWTVVICVGLSIFLHGLTSTPARRRLPRRGTRGGVT